MHKHPVLKIVKIIIIILALATIVIMFANHHVTKQEKHSTQNNIQNTRNINLESKRYNAQKVNNQFNNQEPNINDAQLNSNKRLKAGLNLAFNGKTNQRATIQNDLSGLSNKVLQVTSKKGSATKVKAMNIGYGEFNTQTKAMPVHIIVRYMAGKTQKYVSYIMTYKPQASYSNQYTLLSYNGNAYN